MDSKWMWIAFAIAFSSMMICVSFGDKRTPTKYESFNDAIKHCSIYTNVRDRNSCFQIVKEKYNLEETE